ncbi:hypothetical protein ACFQW6_07235 [Nocardioides sp. GCM10028917]|uniref:hypothetical protein n=1 Tax=Nocardioides sp. GCM10028917 TaxID=3273408 RepID=UPI003619DBF6
MAELDGSIPTTLGALVGAATFAAGFLSTRVHRQRDQALMIATETDALADAAARAGEPIPPEVLRNQLRALDEAGNDRLDRVAGASVVVLAGSAVVLALVTARAQGVGGSSEAGRLLIAFVVAALVVLTVAVVDLVFSRRDVSRRRAASILGLMERSDRLWAGTGTVPEDRWKEALATATAAVRRSRGMFGPAWQVLGNTYLARLGMPRPPADTWVNARWAFDRATALGPESAGLRWARAYLLEIGPEPDWEECVREWVRGCWLHHEATRPLARTDEIVEGPDERTHRTIAANRGEVPAPDTLRFRPRDPVVFAGALGRIPPMTSVASLTARLLYEGIRREPDAAATAAQVCVEWLERQRHTLGFLGDVVADSTARSLLAPDDPPGWFETIEHYVSEEGPIRRAQREADAVEAAAEAERHARHEEITRRLEDLDAWVNGDEATDDMARDPDQEIDWDVQIARNQERLHEIDTMRREHQDWLDQQQDRQAENERQSRDLRDSLDRLDRIRAGRATEADLIEAQIGVDDLPDAPWPEPRPRPGDPPAEPRDPG